MCDVTRMVGYGDIGLLCYYLFLQKVPIFTKATHLKTLILTFILRYLQNVVDLTIGDTRLVGYVVEGLICRSVNGVIGIVGMLLLVV